MIGQQFVISLVVNRKICSYPVTVKVNGYAHKVFEVRGKNKTIIIQYQINVAKKSEPGSWGGWAITEGYISRDYKFKIFEAIKKHLDTHVIDETWLKPRIKR